jgi:23S rRNA pseudouridine1911/1915/1917 synthase
VPKQEFLIAPGAGADERLDVYLARRLQDFTRSEFQRFIDLGRIVVNGATKKSSYKLRDGDRVEADVVVPVAAATGAEDIPLRILHRDADIIVVDKAAGMIVHPGAGARQGTLVNALLHHFPDIRGIGDEDRPGIVHRLDKETSGVMVVARSLAAYGELLRQFKAREIEKVYLALVRGRLPSTVGRFDWPIGRHVKHGQRMSIETRKPRSAITDYRVQTVFKDFSLLEIRPLTGRTHQIRVHLTAAGHPLAGDRRYGSGGQAKARFPRLFLHAHRLAFRHPVSRQPLEFLSPLPDDLASVLKSVE